MERIASTRRLPLYGVPATRRAEAAWAALLPPQTLMRRAGAAVAQLALAIAPHARRVWVAAGPGNNGGDGVEAALHLKAAGRRVAVTLCGDAARLPADAAAIHAGAQAAGLDIAADIPRSPDEFDLAIDGLLGIGASRAPSGAVAEAIERLNGCASLGRPVLAIDVPSGLDADAGRLLGPLAVRATHTLALLTLKPGLYTGRGRDHAGTVWFDDLGAAAGAHADVDAWLGGAPAAVARRHASHKGSYGNVGVVGGAPGMAGAALLAARAALAAGAGRVYVGLLDAAAPTLDGERVELMFRRAFWQGEPDFVAGLTVVCGCGGGDAVRDALPALLSTAPRLVLDADALNAIDADSALQTLLRAREARGRPTVLTPHPLEAARMLGVDTAAVQSDRVGAARRLAERYACVALLKGSGSVIAAPGETPVVNPTGDASLATAGTGDVLAGWLGGLWAGTRVADETLHAAAMRVAADAAWLHGDAAERAGLRVLRAGELIERLAAAR